MFWLLLAAFASAARALPVVPRVNSVRTLVSVEHRVADHWELLGSGTLVKSHLTDHRYEVVTAQHVLNQVDDAGVSHREDLRVCGILHKEMRCTIVRKENMHDLPIRDVALMGIDVHYKIAAVAPLGSRMHLLDKVTLQGFPQGEMIAMDGQVIGAAEGYWKVYGWCDHGSSGGGVFYHRQLVGVIEAIKEELWTEVRNICYVQQVNIE